MKKFIFTGLLFACLYSPVFGENPYEVVNWYLASNPNGMSNVGYSLTTKHYGYQYAVLKLQVDGAYTRYKEIIEWDMFELHDGDEITWNWSLALPGNETYVLNASLFIYDYSIIDWVEWPVIIHHLIRPSGSPDVKLSLLGSFNHQTAYEPVSIPLSYQNRGNGFGLDMVLEFYHNNLFWDTSAVGVISPYIDGGYSGDFSFPTGFAPYLSTLAVTAVVSHERDYSDNSDSVTQEFFSSADLRGYGGTISDSQPFANPEFTFEVVNHGSGIGGKDYWVGTYIWEGSHPILTGSTNVYWRKLLKPGESEIISVKTGARLVPGWNSYYVYSYETKQWFFANHFSISNPEGDVVLKDLHTDADGVRFSSNTLVMVDDGDDQIAEVFPNFGVAPQGGFPYYWGPANNLSVYNGQSTAEYKGRVSGEITAEVIPKFWVSSYVEIVDEQELSISLSNSKFNEFINGANDSIARALGISGGFEFESNLNYINKNVDFAGDGERFGSHQSVEGTVTLKFPNSEFHSPPAQIGPFTTRFVYTINLKQGSGNINAYKDESKFSPYGGGGKLSVSAGLSVGLEGTVGGCFDDLSIKGTAGNNINAGFEVFTNTNGVYGKGSIGMSALTLTLEGKIDLGGGICGTWTDQYAISELGFELTTGDMPLISFD